MNDLSTSMPNLIFNIIQNLNGLHFLHLDDVVNNQERLRTKMKEFNEKYNFDIVYECVLCPEPRFKKMNKYEMYLH